MRTEELITGILTLLGTLIIAILGIFLELFLIWVTLYIFTHSFDLPFKTNYAVGVYALLLFYRIQFKKYKSEN